MRSSGFTLVEVVVSLALLSGLALAAIASITTMADGARLARTQLHDGAGIEAVFRMIADDLRTFDLPTPEALANRKRDRGRDDSKSVAHCARIDGATLKIETRVVVSTGSVTSGYERAGAQEERLQFARAQEVFYEFDKGTGVLDRIDGAGCRRRLLGELRSVAWTIDEKYGLLHVGLLAQAEPEESGGVHRSFVLR